ncbi:MAG: hypothetical protein GY746_08700 [Gammaproteobacteria bacterium]|nr:hypothetical protein [Gammaproteobacteria bacterium]
MPDQDRNQDQLPLKQLNLYSLDLATFEPAYDVARLDPISQNSRFIDAVEDMSRDMDDVVEEEVDKSNFTIATITGLTMGFSVGLVTWILRAGSLLASFISVVPLWRQFDPLPILSEDAVKLRQGRAGNEGQAESGSEDAKVEDMFEQRVELTHANEGSS